MNNRLKKFEAYILKLNMNANYQPVVLKYLVDVQTASKDQIALVLQQANKKKRESLQFFKHVPVYTVLLGHKERFVKLDSQGDYYIGLKMSGNDRNYFCKLLARTIRKRGKN